MKNILLLNTVFIKAGFTGIGISNKMKKKYFIFDLFKNW
jgi:hypothetical protein